MEEQKVRGTQTSRYHLPLNLWQTSLPRGLSFKDLVVLSGAHTFGFAQCSPFKRRLFNIDGTGKSDPSLDAPLLSNLQCLCSDESGSGPTLEALDPVTTSKFDNVYCKNLLNGSGLLESDQALMGDSNGASLTSSYSKKPLLFLKDFLRFSW